MKFGIILAAMFLASTASAQLDRQPAPENAQLYFVAPAHGEVVTSPVTVKFGLQNMGVAPALSFQDAGSMTQFPHTGHHHIVIDAPLPPLDQPVPANANYVHFGTGATQATLDLAPGEHTLQLILGDSLHIPHDPAVVSEQITITVVE